MKIEMELAHEIGDTVGCRHVTERGERRYVGTVIAIEIHIRNWGEGEPSVYPIYSVQPFVGRQQQHVGADHIWAMERVAVTTDDVSHV